MKDVINEAEIRKELAEYGCTEPEIADIVSSAYHEEMRKAENVFLPYSGKYCDGIDQYKTFFIWFMRETGELKNPVKGDYTYMDYLSSYYWRMLSLYYRNFIECECRKCGSTASLQVHHKTYKFEDTSILGKEFKLLRTNANPLITLCAECHGKEHGVSAVK